MDRRTIDRISKKFIASICYDLPKIDFGEAKKAPMYVRRIDRNPAALVRFVAEVSQHVFNIFPLKGHQFPVWMTKLVASHVMCDLADESFSSEPIETRLMLFWAGVLRLLAKFKITKSEYNLTANTIADINRVAEEIRNSALGYNVCSAKKVRDFIGESNMSL